VKRTRKVTILRVHRRLTHVQSSLVYAACPACGYQVETLSRSEAADVLEIDDRALEWLIFQGEVHAIETVAGGSRICKDSLFPKDSKHKEHYES